MEFWFKPGQGSRVEYRSASRIGESDGNINRYATDVLLPSLPLAGQAWICVRIENSNLWPRLGAREIGGEMLPSQPFGDDSLNPAG